MTPIGPANSFESPRFSHSNTFARLPGLSEVDRADITIVGAPFDSGVSYRPGARFGPSAIRAGSKLLRPYHPALDIEPFSLVQVADAGDLALNPFDIQEALQALEEGGDRLTTGGSRLLTLGGDHTIALALLRSVHKRHGQVALLHFDAHLDTWDTYFGAPYTHGTPFRRAFEESLLAPDASIHVGTRGPLYSASDLTEDKGFGFAVITSDMAADMGPDLVAQEIRKRVGSLPLYISIDIDVLDPAFAPGTGTPEAGGLMSREILRTLRGLAGANIVGADIVEVSPAYDHAEITSIAASHIAFELIALMSLSIAKGSNP